MRARASIESANGWFPLEVSGQPKTIALSEVALSFALEHASIEDLVITLQPPRGAALDIRKRAGSGAGLEIIDESLPSNRQVNPNGTWTLIVEDKIRDAEAGVLKTWKLKFP